MKDPETVECNTHGSTRAAYVCQHLSRGEALGFYWGVDPDEPNSPCPDAWCAECEEVLDAAGEWTEEASDSAGIKLVCAECYVDIRGRNWIEDDEAFEKLAIEYSTMLTEKQASLRQAYEIDNWERWDWYQESQQLIFSHNNKPKVIADIAFVGSHSTKSDTWMWSWANPHFPQNVQDTLDAVREFGEENNFMKLAAGYWRADDQDGWLMTSFASRILGGIGGYRTPSETGHTYMTILNAQWAV